MAYKSQQEETGNPAVGPLEARAEEKEDQTWRGMLSLPLLRFSPKLAPS